MLNQLLKFTLISSVLLWLKPRWRGLLALSVVVIAIHTFHGEYLDYAERSGDYSFLLWSYIIKWIALTAAVLLYIVCTIAGQNKQMPRVDETRIKKNSRGNAPPSADDGFDFLRTKRHLQSRADKILASNKRDQ
ncbi:MAG: hypothetical protein P8J79_01615 [Halioglobus sp.]|nr:hypothetical protein [Halioglobus sp.]